ncbi:Uncharacterised protein [Legionella waltersii]|nr:hypothetical protein [Legionella waltersii]SNV03445.1 Uncharacterised protein [Legionella waltersii]
MMTGDGTALTTHTMIGCLSAIRKQHNENKPVLVDQTKTVDKQKGIDETPHHSPNG